MFPWLPRDGATAAGTKLDIDSKQDMHELHDIVLTQHISNGRKL